MSKLHCRTLLLAIVLACLPAARASAQTEPPRGLWVAVGGTSTTMQGACGEGCDTESPYFHTGTVLADIDRQTRPEQEIRLFPSTYNTASVGGFIAGFVLTFVFRGNSPRQLTAR